MLFERIDGLLCDLDGVLYRGDAAIPGASETIAAARAHYVKVVFCTNNSRATVEQYRQKLAALGVPTDEDEVLTSAVVTAQVLDQRGFKGASAIVVGGEGIRAALEAIDIRLVDAVAGSSDLVIVGWDPTFTYDAMRGASIAVRAGATFIATNDDAAFPAAEALWPGAGAILSSIEVAADRKAEVMGKPHRPMMEAAARRFGPNARVAVVGDRPETDLKGGARMGWTTVLVLTGVTSADDARRLESAPDFVIGSLSDLPSLDL
jgi:phosphoglycolate/pyridoxal phosphate phosphatase family enzyme